MLRPPCLLSLVLVGATLGCTAIVDLEHLDGAQTVGAGGTTGSAGSGIGGSAAPGGPGSGGGATSDYATVVLGDQPLGYWRLDEPAGPTAFSLVLGAPSGSYDAGCTLGAAGAVELGNNTAVQFDGVSCSIDFGDAFAFEDMASFSLEVWVNPGVADSPLGRILSKEEDLAGKHQGYVLLLDGANISFDRWRDDALDGVDSASTIAQGSFTHVVATYGGSRLRVYINGQLSAEADSTKALANVSAPFVAGASSTFTNFFQGALDEIAVYGTELSEAQVLAHYGAGFTGL